MSNKSALSFASLCLADVENPPCANLHKCDYFGPNPQTFETNFDGVFDNQIVGRRHVDFDFHAK